MAESGIKTNIDTVELLMNIKEDVGVIKNDMSHFKEKFEEFREEQQENTVAINQRLKKLEDKVEVLEDQKDKEDAKKYHKVVAFILTALGGIFIAKLPDIIQALIQIFSKKG